mmetsp:Transcript_8692/g.21196  ORF Transcript_8692/g.21196 Transcript_8692/m.21196 type:complete len:277 (+) Transcript_8692:159-989(+)
MVGRLVRCRLFRIGKPHRRARLEKEHPLSHERTLFFLSDRDGRPLSLAPYPAVHGLQPPHRPPHRRGGVGRRRPSLAGAELRSLPVQRAADRLLALALLGEGEPPEVLGFLLAGFGVLPLDRFDGELGDLLGVHLPLEDGELPQDHSGFGRQPGPPVGTAAATTAGDGRRIAAGLSGRRRPVVPLGVLGQPREAQAGEAQAQHVGLVKPLLVGGDAEAFQEPVGDVHVLRQRTRFEDLELAGGFVGHVPEDLAPSRARRGQLARIDDDVNGHCCAG